MFDDDLNEFFSEHNLSPTFLDETSCPVTRVGDFLSAPFDCFRTEIVDHSANRDNNGGRLWGVHGRAVIGTYGKRNRDHFEVQRNRNPSWTERN